MLVTCSFRVPLPLRLSSLWREKLSSLERIGDGGFQSFDLGLLCTCTMLSKMERHKCKLCSKSFCNGRALGGHMRSHLATLTSPPKIQRLGDRTDSALSLSSSEEEKRESEEKALGYGLRKNPKQSFRLADPEFLDAGSVVQDRESETESTRNPARPGLGRNRKVGVGEKQSAKKLKLRKPSSNHESAAEIELALCLLMLSRDTWSGSDDSDELKPSQTRGRYEKVYFRSFQAMSGNRTSHKRLKTGSLDHENESDHPRNDASDNALYQCPFCCKVYGSGQALGGHKRSHLLASSSSIAAAKFGNCSIDLNLPAPVEDEDEDLDFNQQQIFEVSVAN